MNKNERLEVEIEDYSSEGYGVAKPDGYVLFIPGTIRGERVLAHVLKAGKSFGYAKAEKILLPSEKRCKPLCPADGACGGCGLWHMDYKEEFDFKCAKVLSNLKKAGLDAKIDKIEASTCVTGYRNKAQYPVREQRGKTVIGFYRRASHDVAEEKCLIQPEIFDKIVACVRRFMQNYSVDAYNELTGKGIIRHIYLRSSGDKRQIMLCLVVNGIFDKKREFIHAVCGEFNEITTVILNYNSKNTNVILGQRFETIYGSGFITDTLCGKKFEISAQAFYQINHDMCEKLYGIAAAFGEVDQSRRVLDLYCGIGTVGICAAMSAKELIGVEIVPQAVNNARRNAVINGLANARFIASDAAGINNLGLGDFDVIFVDPPRKGCDRSTLDFIISSSAEKLVYISCDSATLARDAAILTSAGFSIKKTAVVDMFARTSHVETVVQFVR